MPFDIAYFLTIFLHFNDWILIQTFIALVLPGNITQRATTTPAERNIVFDGRLSNRWTLSVLKSEFEEYPIKSKITSWAKSHLIESLSIAQWGAFIKYLIKGSRMRVRIQPITKLNIPEGFDTQCLPQAMNLKLSDLTVIHALYLHWSI
jgi:hypothetical protein